MDATQKLLFLLVSAELPASSGRGKPAPLPGKNRQNIQRAGKTLKGFCVQMRIVLSNDLCPIAS